MLKRYTYIFVCSGLKGYSGPKGCSDNSGPTGRSDNSGPTGRFESKTISDSLLYYALWKSAWRSVLTSSSSIFCQLKDNQALGEALCMLGQFC
ncbi:hypothetical protein CsSME_00028307 [Camellia sinensis var. sinensis]